MDESLNLMAGLPGREELRLKIVERTKKEEGYLISHNTAMVEFDYGLIIACPVCGASTDMHPNEVKVWIRGEDSSIGNYAHVGRNVISSTTEGELPEGNPSCRRDGIIIKFNCWECGANTRLAISQHKGATSIYWELWDIEHSYPWDE